MRRLASLVLLTLFVGGCGATEAPPPASTTPAGPQHTQLDWIERYPADRPGLVFTTHSFTVTKTGWNARVSIENRTPVRWTLGADPVGVLQGFGVMLFEDGDLADLERRNREGQMPALRAAESFSPALPPTLAPGSTWEGKVGARGSLVSGRFVRLVFGTLSTKHDPPAGIGNPVVWITDHAHRLS